MKFFLSNLLLITLVGTLLQAQTDSKVNHSFEDKVQAWMAEYNVPAVGIGLVENGEIKDVQVFGELKSGVPAPDNTIFNIASITKPVTGMLTLKLVEKGQWDLDEPLFQFWVDPDVADEPYHKILTTRHILTHQSGFTNWRWSHPTKKLTFDFEPGADFQYSGEGFVYLCRALENKFDKSLAELADSILFKPLGMKDSRLYWDENMDTSRFAAWHDSEGNLHNPSTPRERGVNAAGSMLATVEDFCKFEIDVMQGAGLSPDLFTDMITIHEPGGRGLGWGVLNELPNGEYVIHHDGSDKGVQTSCLILPESGRALVVLTNGDNGMLVWRKVIIEALDVGKEIINAFFGTKTHEIINLPDTILQQYTGKFIDNFDKVYTIVKIENGLHFSGKGVPTLKLYPETENTFFPEEFEFKFDFVTPDSVAISVQEEVKLIINRIE